MKFTVILKTHHNRDSELVAWMKKYWQRDFDKVLNEWDEQGYATVDLSLLRTLVDGFGHHELFDEVSIYAGDSSVGRQLHSGDILTLLHSKKKDIVDDEDIYLHESKENKNINSLFERVLNEIWDNPSYHPREPKYASRPSEREVWLNSKFDPKFVVEFNGQIVRVMPISKDILLIRDGNESANSFVYNIETALFLDRIRDQASRAINENIFGARSNFYLNVYTSDHRLLAQWDMRWDDSGTTLSVYSDTGVKESFSSTDEDIAEALGLCTGKWEDTLSELFEDAIPETLDDTLRKEFLKESRRASRKNKLKESELPDDLVKMLKDDGGFVGQNVEGMIEDGCEDPVDMILENEVDAYLYDSYVSNKYPEYEKDYKKAVYAAAYDYLVDKGLI